MKQIKDKKIVVGLSGGIDSAVTLWLLKEQGWSPVGVSLLLPLWDKSSLITKKEKFPPQTNFTALQKFCLRLKIPYFIYDVRKDFLQTVGRYYLKELRHNRTPNPCLICNPQLKIKKLWQWARKHQINYIATGHYAKIKYNHKAHLFELYRGKDKVKDQSYELALLNQRQLRHLILPLGNLSKKEVYQIAKKEQWMDLLSKKESQDFCFLANSTLRDFLEKHHLLKPGVIKDTSGKILGQHPGIKLFTQGQRKGLNLSGGPFYVVQKIPQKNILIVSHNYRDLFKKEIRVYPYHLISGKRITSQIKVKIKIRYRQKLIAATIIPLSSQSLKIEFKKPVFAPTPGQFAVFYQREKCLGGGIIRELI